MAIFESFGGAGVVTGSCHLLEVNGLNILIDCGMFQGDERGLNYEGFTFDPKEIDYLIVTHAHLDHIGRIPMLVKQGFKGSIITTRATYAIARLMLHNAGAIIESKPNPIYTSYDVDPALAKFDQFLDFDEWLEIGEGVKVKFKNAGHILGSATVKIKYEEDGVKKSVVFSGDIGQEHRIITSSLQKYKKANFIFLESTYGDRLHKNINISIMELKSYIEDVTKSGGTVVIPSFALERTQEILYLLRQLSLKGLLKKIPVYLDAPLAINVTKTFLNYPKLFSNEIQELIKANKNPFDFEELIHTESKSASKAIAHKGGAKIIIAGSGMCEGGRIQSHLLRYLGDNNAMILFVGYQVPGTLGHSIINDKTVEIEGNTIVKNAVIKYIDGFSAHADRDDLFEWVNGVKDLETIFLIHGDKEPMQLMAKGLKKKVASKVKIVKMHKRIKL